MIGIGTLVERLGSEHASGAAPAFASEIASVDPPWKRLPADFHDRQEIVSILSHAVDVGGVHVLSGVGGSGKTALALLAADVARRRGRRVWWIPSDDSTVLATHLIAVLKNTDTDEVQIGRARQSPTELRRLVRERLTALDNRWLLVFDNADSPQVLVGNTHGDSEDSWVRPIEGGLILVASRRQNGETWGRDVRVHHLEPLPLEDAAQMLLRLAPDSGDDVAARALAERLGRLPLALRLAGRYLALARSEIRSFAAYIRTVDEQHALLIDQGAVGDEDRDRITCTWEVTLDSLARQGIPEVRGLMRLMSCYAAAPCPIRIFDPVLLGGTAIFPGDFDQQRLDLVLGELSGYGLLELTEEVIEDGQRAETLVTGHPLVLEVNAEHLAAFPDIRHTTWAAAIALLTRASSTTGRVVTPIGHQRWPHWRLAQPHHHNVAIRAPEHDRDLLAEALDVGVDGAVYLYTVGFHSEAERVLEVYHNRGEPSLGSEHPTMLRLRYYRALVWRGRGRLPEAENELREVLATRRRIAGDDAPETLDAWHDLIRLLWTRFRLRAAEDECRGLLRAREQALGRRHRDTMSTLGQLARIQASRGHLGAAEEATRQVLAFREYDFTMGPTHQYTLAARGDLVSLRWKRGALEEAERMARALTEAWATANLQPDYPNALCTRQHLAGILWSRGAVDEAETQIAGMLDIQDRAAGPDHPRTLAARADLIGVRWARRAVPAGETEAELRQILERQHRVLGSDHPDSLATRHLTAGVLWADGHTRAAQDELLDVQAAQESILGIDHPDTLATKSDLAALRWSDADLDTAFDLLRSVQAIQERTLGPDHPDTFTTRAEIAGLQRARGNVEDGDPAAHAVYQLQRETLGTDHPDTRATARNRTGQGADYLVSSPLWWCLPANDSPCWLGKRKAPILTRPAIPM